jgi:hypothetical protein
MCRPITIGDLYRLAISTNPDLESASQLAFTLLGALPCPPDCIGQLFWENFVPVPVVGGEGVPSATCECGGLRDACGCVESAFTIEEGKGIILDEFHFAMSPSDMASGSNVQLYPFGYGPVPSSLKICELAHFKIYAFKNPVAVIPRCDFDCVEEPEETRCEAVDEVFQRRRRRHSDSSSSSSDDDDNAVDFGRRSRRFTAKGDGDCEGESDIRALAQWVLANNGKRTNQGLRAAALATLQEAKCSLPQGELLTLVTTAVDILTNGTNGVLWCPAEQASSSCGGTIAAGANILDPGDCEVPEVPPSPVAVYTVGGKWLCEQVECCAPCDVDASGVRYRIVFDESTLRHGDGGELCEGWQFFNSPRFSHFVIDMESQCLPFHRCKAWNPETDCGCK